MGPPTPVRVCDIVHHDGGNSANSGSGLLRWAWLGFSGECHRDRGEDDREGRPELEEPWELAGRQDAGRPPDMLPPRLGEAASCAKAKGVCVRHNFAGDSDREGPRGSANFAGDADRDGPRDSEEADVQEGERPPLAEWNLAAMPA